jgi:hypothetical protein
MAAAEAWVASESTWSSAARMSWRIESMLMVSCHAVVWSVTMLFTCGVVFLCSCRSHDGVPGRYGGAGGRQGSQDFSGWKATMRKHLTETKILA